MWTFSMLCHDKARVWCTGKGGEERNTQRPGSMKRVYYNIIRIVVDHIKFEIQVVLLIFI